MRRLLALSLLTLTACGTGTPATPTGSGVQPCASLPAADPDATLPPDFPRLPEQVLYGPASQGSTTIVFGRVPGEDFAGLRDELADGIEAAGYRVDGTDQEAVEAEAHFSRTAAQRSGSSPREGSVRVKRLCEDVLEVRYRLSG